MYELTFISNRKMSLLNAMVLGIIMYILAGTWGLLICSVGRLVKSIRD